MTNEIRNTNHAIRWGIIGAGKIADRQMASAMGQAAGQRLVAVMRRDLAQAQAFAAKYAVPAAYDRVEDLLADPAVTAVYVATPPHAHLANTTLAAEAGKHILVEKPMARSVTEGREMLRVCQVNGVRLMVCYYQRYNTRHQQIKQLLEAGAIGQVTAVRINFSDLYPPIPGAWHHDPAISGGGPLMDLAPHCLDLARYLCGPATQVLALVDTLASQSPVEDTATILLRLANGAQAVVTTHWSVAQFEPERQNGLEIMGTQGTISAGPISSKDSSGTLRLLTAAGSQSFDVAPGGRRPHVALLEDFAAAIATGQPTPIPGEDGLMDLLVIQAAYESARTSPVQLPVMR